MTTQQTSAPARLRALLKQDGMIVAPGAYDCISARVIAQAGFPAVYMTGAGTAAMLGYPDFGLVTMSEMAENAGRIAAAVGVPVIADADTGYGNELNVTRTVREYEKRGVAGLHIEDQGFPKKCGHLEGKELIDVEEMVKKVITAKDAAHGDVLVVARTDARATEGLDSAIERARAYAKAGADIIFPEALPAKADFTEFRRKIRQPLMANMTEFGKTPYMTATEFEKMGYNIVIFPVTAFRAMMKAVEKTFTSLKQKGSQKEILSSLMTREEFYELIDYRSYEAVDKKAMDTARRLSKEST